MKKQLLGVVIIALLSAHVTEAANYVTFVNIAGAVDSVLFAEAVTNFVVNVFPARTRVAARPSIDFTKIMDPKKCYEGLGADTGLAVYFVKDAKFPPQLVAPRMWAVINVRNLEKGADKKKFVERLHRMVLKGLAFACGLGANQDRGRCVMGAGSFDTLEGIDGTSASYSPFAHFPMMDFMTQRGLVLDITAE